MKRVQAFFQKRKKEKKEFTYEKTKKSVKFTKVDWIYLAIIVVLFSFFGFYKLGTTTMASTYWKPDENGDSVVLKIEDEPIERIYFLVGVGEDPNGNHVNLEEMKFEIEASADMINWKPVALINHISMFRWMTIDTSIIANPYIRVRGYDKAVVLNEVGFKIAGKEKLAKVEYINGTSYTYTGRELIDEQDKIALNPSYYNSSYFDEIYHARTGYEQLKQYPIYETTHPVLGKEAITGGIAIFGMNPFGWRFAGVFFGILMLPILYNMLKQMFQNSLICFAATFLFAFDFMHFTQSRLATIDTYAVISILLIYYFMYRYYRTSFFDGKFKSSLKPLFFCGIFVGLGFASKWNVAYGFIGIAILFFMNMWKRFQEYRHAKKEVEKNHSTDEMDLYVYKNFFPFFGKTILWCILFFIIIPLVIYYLSYIFIFDIRNIPEYTKNVIQYNWNMWEYHHRLVATHPFESPWYEWPFIIRPIWYSWDVSFSQPNSVSTITGMGSPMVWWTGLVTMIVTFVTALIKKDKTGYFIVIGYLSVYLPWIAISRIAFIYHYYPAMIFLVLSMAYVMNLLFKKWKWIRYVIPIYVALAFVLFLIFFPVLSGTPTTREYVKRLQWLPRWNFYV